MRGLCNGWDQKVSHANVWTLTGRVVARSVSHWLLTMVVRVHCRGRSCGIFGGQSGTWRSSLAPNTSHLVNIQQCSILIYLPRGGGVGHYAH